jgi:hypothetical protein
MSVILIALITAITYGNIYDNSFVFDDTRSIADNPAIRNPDSLLSFKQPSIPRILVNLTYSLNYRFGKLEVFGYHLVNVIIHILNGILVYFLSRLLFKKLTSFSQP